MNNKNIKLDNLKAEQKAKSKKTKIFEAYIKKSKNIEDKIALIKLKQRDDSSLFLESIKTFMKKAKRK